VILCCHSYHLPCKNYGWKWNVPATVAVKVVRMVSLAFELDMTLLNNRAANTHTHTNRAAKLGMLMYRCQHNQAPRYLIDHCSPVSDVVFQQRLCSASSHQLSVPRHRLSTYGRRAFSVAEPAIWNSLPDDPECSGNIFRQSLKTFLFSQY